MCEVTGARAPRAHAYRPDIDGLRALAVLAVLLFHLEVWPFTGGFAGVDIFFVISGYLISGIIHGWLTAGRFSLADFYARRIRRIFPALYLTVFVTIAGGFVLLDGHELAMLLQALSYLAVFLSNVFFMEAGGYFDAPLGANPVLQTWSLSVEEQFYLAFPLILMLAWRHARPYLNWIILALALTSLGIGALRVAIEPHRAFFATDVRIFELMIGAMLALGFVPILGGRVIREAASALGLALMLVSIAWLNADVPFPGLAALPVCVGAALVIWAGEGGALPLVNRVLAWRVPVGIGLISYSVYLLHWPAIVYARKLTGGDLALAHKIGLALFALGAGYLSWRFIETPFRRPRAGAAVRGVFASAAALIAVLAGGSLASERFLFSPSPAVAALAAEARRIAKSNPCLLGVSATPDQWPQQLCLDDGDGPLVVAWGDSYAGHYFAALREHVGSKGARLAAFGMGACPPAAGLVIKERPQCDPFNAMVMDRITRLRPKVVIVSANWINYEKRRGLGRNDVLARLRATFDTIRAAGSRIIVIGPSPVFATSVPFLASSSTGEAEQQPSGAPARYSRMFDAFFRDLAARGVIGYLPAYETFCDRHAMCRFRRAQTLYFWDMGHMTRAGGDIVVGEVDRLLLAPLFAR